MDLFHLFRYNSKYVFYHILIAICVSSLVSTIYMVCGASTPLSSTEPWRLIFYTGDKIWSGTDSMVYVQIHGNIDSQIFQLYPDKYQMEAQAVDTYLLQLPSQLGNVKSITVGKQHSYSFFNDWQIVKAELIDPKNKRYTFNCNCWLTTLRYKRTMEVTSIDGIDTESGNSDQFSISSPRTTRIFPMTIGLLFLLLILIIFTYFGNVICKKWKESLFLRGKIIKFLKYLLIKLIIKINFKDPSRTNRNRNNSNGNRSTRNRSSRVVLNAANNNNNNNNSRNLLRHTNNNNNNLYKDDDENEIAELSTRDGVYNFTNNLSDLNVNSTANRSIIESQARNSHSLISEDKPPEYTQLFPIKSINEIKPIEEENNHTINTNKIVTAESSISTSV